MSWVVVFWNVEKTESFLGTAEDKEATEPESKKLSEQEVSPFFSPFNHHFLSFLLYCLVHHLMGHHTVTITHHSQKTLVKLRHLLTCLFLPFTDSILSPSVVLSVFPRQASTVEPASAPEKATDSDENKGNSEEKTGDERNRTESPSTKTEPSANPKEPAFKQSEAQSTITSPKSERFMICVLQILLICKAVLCLFIPFSSILSGAMQRNRKVLRKRRHWFSSGKNWRQGK